MPERPPKVWFDKMKRRMQQQYPTYGEKRIQTITAGIWHDYSEATKTRITGEVEMSACISSGAKNIFKRMFQSKLEGLDKTSKEGKLLKSLLDDLDFMSICKEGARKARKPRKPGKWQLCIKEERTGKPFDPQAISKLKLKYRAGTCPSPEFLKKHQI